MGVKLYHSTDMCYSSNGSITGTREKIGGRDFLQLQIERAEKALSGVEICLSDRPLMGFGLIIETNVSRLFAADMDSFYEGDGVRQVGVCHQEDDGQVFYEAKGVALSSSEAVYGWIKEEAPKLRGRKHDALSYAEVFGRGGKVVGVYVAPGVLGEIAEKSKEVASHLAEHFGVEIVETDRYVSIYD